jgi:hypothetical protein
MRHPDHNNICVHTDFIKLLYSMRHQDHNNICVHIDFIKLVSFDGSKNYTR